MSSTEYNDIIRFSVSAILQDRINSRIAINEDTKDITDFLTKIQTDHESLMDFVGLNIIKSF